MRTWLGMIGMSAVVCALLFSSVGYLLCEEAPIKRPRNEIEMKNGKILKVKAAIKTPANTVSVILDDGRSFDIKGEQMSNSERKRWFGEDKEPEPVAVDYHELKKIGSKLPSDFNPGKFTKSFKVKCDDLKADIYFTPFYAMPYRYFAPENLKKSQKVPLVVFLHGLGEYRTDNRKQLSKHPQCLIFVQPWMQEKYPCFFMAPQLNEEGGWCGWSQGTKNGCTKEMQIVIDIIDEMLEKYPAIDADRIYVTGLSSGGLGA